MLLLHLACRHPAGPLSDEGESSPTADRRDSGAAHAPSGGGGGGLPQPSLPHSRALGGVGGGSGDGAALGGLDRNDSLQTVGSQHQSQQQAQQQFQQQQQLQQHQAQQQYYMQQHAAAQQLLHQGQLLQAGALAAGNSAGPMPQGSGGGIEGNSRQALPQGPGAYNAYWGGPGMMMPEGFAGGPAMPQCSDPAAPMSYGGWQALQQQYGGMPGGMQQQSQQQQQQQRQQGMSWSSPGLVPLVSSGSGGASDPQQQRFASAATAAAAAAAGASNGGSPQPATSGGAGGSADAGGPRSGTASADGLPRPSPSNSNTVSTDGASSEGGLGIDQLPPKASLLPQQHHGQQQQQQQQQHGLPPLHPAGTATASPTIMLLPISSGQAGLTSPLMHAMLGSGLHPGALPAGGQLGSTNPAAQHQLLLQQQQYHGWVLQGGNPRDLLPTGLSSLQLTGSGNGAAAAAGHAHLQSTGAA